MHANGDTTVSLLISKLQRRLEHTQILDTPVTFDGVPLSDDELQLYYRLLNVMEHQCQQRLFGIGGLQWSMARCGERSATADQNHLLVGEKVNCSYLPAHQNIKMHQSSAGSLFGSTGWAGWVLPLKAQALLAEGDNHAGRIILRLPLTCTVAAAGLPDDEQAQITVYFDAGSQANETADTRRETRDAWADLIASKWHTDHTELYPATGIPSNEEDPAEKSLWGLFARQSFPWKNRLLNIPLRPLLQNARPEDDGLLCYIDTGSSRQASRICRLLRNSLMLNMVGVVNQYAFQKDHYKPGDSLINDTINPAVRQQALNDAESGIQILTATNKDNGSSFYERRWAESTDPDLLFDVVPQRHNTTDSNTSDWQSSSPKLRLCGHHSDITRLRLTGLIGVTWTDDAICSGDIAEFTHDSEGLLLAFNGHTLSTHMDLKDRLVRRYSRLSDGSVYSEAELIQAAIEDMPPALIAAVKKAVGRKLLPKDLLINKRFGKHPQYPGYAVPLTFLSLPVNSPEDELLQQQCEWLCRALTARGLPPGVCLQVSLEAAAACEGLASEIQRGASHGSPMD